MSSSSNRLAWRCLNWWQRIREFGLTAQSALPYFAIMLFVASLQSGQLRINIDPTIALEGDSGACILRVRVDGSADLILKDEQLTIRTISGTDPVDEGSVCSAPMPELPLRSFRMDLIRGRGRVLLVENPAGRNAFQASIRVDDPQSGDELYEMRVAWRFEDAGSGDTQDELVLKPGTNPTRWVAADANSNASDLPGTRLNSFENDPLRYESNRSGQLEFRGRIDGTVEFYIRSDHLNAEILSGQPVKVERFRFTQPLPDSPLSTLTIEKKDGRGTVEITQQPTEANGYTAKVRVEDGQGGSDRYHWVLAWIH